MEQEVKTILLHELPELLEHDPQIRESIWRMLVPYYAPRQETESRFDRVLGEIQRMREESERKWQEQQHKWDENQAELRQMREESERKWQENQATLNRMLTEIARVDKKIDSKIGALGAR
jgi:chromosome segregation ATPase